MRGHGTGLEGQPYAGPESQALGQEPLSGALVSPCLQFQEGRTPPRTIVCAKVPVGNCEGLSLLPVLFLPSQSCLRLQETDTLGKTGRHRLRVSGCWKSQRLPNPERAGASPFWSANGDIDCHLLSTYCTSGPYPCTVHFTYKVTLSPQPGLPILQLREVRLLAQGHSG